MNFFESIASGMLENWQYWLVSVVLVIAAVIDGIQLKVPNWITFPMIVSGWIYSAVAFGLAGDGWYVDLAGVYSARLLDWDCCFLLMRLVEWELAMSNFWQVSARGYTHLQPSTRFAGQ